MFVPKGKNIMFEKSKKYLQGWGVYLSSRAVG
jgi:hypothetical protein